MITYSTSLNALGPYTDDSGNPFWIVNGVKTYYNPGPYPNLTPGTVPTSAPVNQITTPIAPKTTTQETTTPASDSTTIAPATDTTTQPTTTNNNTLYIALGILAVIFLIRKMK